MQNAPIHQSHVYGRIKISQTIFEKGYPRDIPVKLFQNLTSGYGEEDFLRISSCLYSARRPHSPEPCLWTDQNFANNFWKGSCKEHFCEITLKSDQRFQRRRFSKNCFKNSISLPWQPEFLMESNSVNKFQRGPPKEHSCQVWSKLAKRFGRRRCLKKLLKTHDGRELKSFRKTLWEKMKLLKMSNFTHFHNVFYAICILKSFNSYISFVVFSFFEFGWS